MPNEEAQAYQKRYEDALNEPVSFEDKLDGLGLEDFPERDYFLEAGALLREASRGLAWAAANCANSPTDALELSRVADRIGLFLKGVKG